MHACMARDLLGQGPTQVDPEEDQPPAFGGEVTQLATQPNRAGMSARISERFPRGERASDPWGGGVTTLTDNT